MFCIFNIKMNVQEKHLTEAREDYLEALLMLSDGGATVRSKDIANFKKVSKASVSAALSTLDELGYICFDGSRAVRLTERGRAVADSTLKKHNMFVDFLVNCLGVDIQSAKESACKMEHAIGSDIAEKFSKFISGEMKKSAAKKSARGEGGARRKEGKKILGKKLGAANKSAKCRKISSKS